ncbi:predicted protein [Chaetoceros tenuissimus]|uniref:Uncharacterized protein n=1 Tax=Chaetoceros tenuissimus TaxID=426638 RepID=A0AAD3H4X5_9STRA|nr:predicted protein [Chaetoceros tenuissimus]
MEETPMPNGRMLHKVFFKEMLQDLLFGQYLALSSLVFYVKRDSVITLSKKLFELVGFAFVDDADLIQSGEDADGLLEKTQLLLDEWRELMAVTAVNPIFILSITVKIKENGKPLTWILEMQSYQF